MTLSEHDASPTNPNPILGDLTAPLLYGQNTTTTAKKNSDNWDLSRYKSALLLKAIKQTIFPLCPLHQLVLDDWLAHWEM